METSINILLIVNSVFNSNNAFILSSDSVELWFRKNHPLS